MVILTIIVTVTIIVIITLVVVVVIILILILILMLVIVITYVRGKESGPFFSFGIFSLTTLKLSNQNIHIQQKSKLVRARLGENWR